MVETRSVIDQLIAATNAHDIDALVGCFASDYVNETPAHPPRGFHGRDQVRRNWTTIFGAVPDIAAKVIASAVEDDQAWTEWEMTGTRADGTPHAMAGVIIFRVADEQIVSARFYLEPVESATGDVTAAVHRQTGAP
ncbi:MAG TPA: nuclear transport factor 2 family protein [Jatrophihabitans sp.]|jgi:ketosteroid isomerase-like protein|nr:nuclear transport factor 2 family protein [Jatrophihabitans sp.]